MKYTRSPCVWYTVSIILWIIVLMAPVYPKVLVKIPYQDDRAADLELVVLFTVPLTICVCVCLYRLFCSANQWLNIPFSANVRFLISVLMVVGGMGMHSVCVLLESHPLPAQDRSLVDLVHFLHEYVSHWMFMIGFYSVLLLVAESERDDVKYHGSKDSKIMSITHITFNWMFNSLFGLFLAKFSLETSTGLPTLVFFILFMYQSYNHFWELVFKSVHSNKIMNASLSRVVFFGLPTQAYMSMINYYELDLPTLS